MSDDPHTDTWPQANAYLDGELTADEAARAEADQAVMAEVATLRTLRSALASVEPPATHARETAIAAALAEFDTISRGAGAPAVVPIRARPRYATWLGAAAAIVAVGLLGVLISRMSLGGDDDDSAAIEASDAGVERAVEDQAGGGDGGGDDAAQLGDAPAATALTAIAEEAGEAAPAAPAPEATEAPAATAPAGVFDAAEADAATEAPDATEAPEAPEATTLSVFVVLTDPIADDTALELVGRQLLERRAAGAPATFPDTPCDDAGSGIELLGQGSWVAAGANRPVLVAIDRATDVIVAIDLDSCVVIATGR